MSRFFDPISQTVIEKPESIDPPSLQSLCRRGILQSLTLSNIEKVSTYILSLYQCLKLNISIQYSTLIWIRD